MTRNKPAYGLLIAFMLLPLILACRFSRPPASTEPAADEPALATATLLPTAESQIEPLQFTTGRNDFVINVDNTPREFILYVPSGYDSNHPTPVVVMCHGSNQHPNNMYENTSWVTKAEEENIIVVFPGSWKYPLIDEPGVHEKWNTPGTEQAVQPGTELKDDVHFIRVIVDDLKATFNVDEHRIYASGFSNGGGFVMTRLLVQMNDLFAAFATSGAGLLGEAEVGVVPVMVNASLYNMIGTNDNKIGESQSIPVPFPLAAEEIVNHPNFGPMLQKTTALLSLEMLYTAESDPNFTRLMFDKSLVGADNEYIFIMIKGLFHVYPGGDDNRAGINAADLFWDFFLKHAKQ